MYNFVLNAQNFPVKRQKQGPSVMGTVNISRENNKEDNYVLTRGYHILERKFLITISVN